MSLLKRLLEYWYYSNTEEDQNVQTSKWKTLCFSSPSLFGKKLNFYSKDSSDEIYTLQTSLLDDARITLSQKEQVLAKAHYSLRSDLLIEYIDLSSGLMRQSKLQRRRGKFWPVFGFVHDEQHYILEACNESNKSKFRQQCRITEKDSKQTIALLSDKSGYRQRGEVKIRKGVPAEMEILALIGTLAFREMQRRKKAIGGSTAVVV